MSEKSNVVPFGRVSKSRAKAPLVWQSNAKAPLGFPAIGIDLGTTNSVVSLLQKSQDHPRSLEFEGQTLVPSMLSWDQASSELLVGTKAKLLLEKFASEVIRSTKREMGRPTSLFQSFGKEFSSEAAATEVLRYLVSHEEIAELKSRFGSLWAVITVPAHFDDAARQATVGAAAAAGIEVMRIINEPTAAALAYSMLPGSREAEHEILAVYDLGGGTFDVSIVERDGLVFNVLASEGDVSLGGDDFDRAVAHRLLDEVKLQNSKVLSASISLKKQLESQEFFRELLVLAEEIKKHLQEEGEFRLLTSSVRGSSLSLDYLFSREEFEVMISPFLQKTLELTERALIAAKKRPNHLSRILLVGGSTRVNLVQKMLQSHFSNCLVDARLEPDLAVSWGAALQAAIISGIEPETILVDVCSHSLGIGVAEDSQAVSRSFKEVCKKFGILPTVPETSIPAILGHRMREFKAELQAKLRVAPIIHRNSPLPAKKSEFFSTLYENQSAVQVVVVQGEGTHVSHCRLIGTFLFQLQKPCPIGTRCEIQLTYDVNGMVHIMAKQLGTENIAQARFDSATGDVKDWVPLKSGEFADVAWPSSPDVHPAGNKDSGSLGSSRSDDNILGEAENEIANALLLRLQKAIKDQSLQQVNSVEGEESEESEEREEREEREEKKAELAELKELAYRYAQLLQQASRGYDCDAELEGLETVIEEKLERLRGSLL